MRLGLHYPSRRLVEQNHDALIAVYGGSLGVRRSHPFVDGNKRAAWLTLRAFLAGNEVEIAADPAEAVTCMVKLADGRMSEEQLAAWLRGKA